MENIKEVRYCCECKADLQPWEENVCNWCRRELAAKEKELLEKEEEENED
jgi:predicted amidophosphoribosyltransferase